jgi:hypothetical protein
MMNWKGLGRKCSQAISRNSLEGLTDVMNNLINHAKDTKTSKK